MSDRYKWRGGSEMWMRRGTVHTHQIVIVEPLFEEKNRTRRLIADVMRGLDANGIGSTLPDLPGTGESLIDIASVALGDWTDALSAVERAVEPLITVAIRGGALLASTGNVWRLSPETGTRIVRDLKRAQLTSQSPTPLYAGHALSDTFLNALASCELPVPQRVRTVRLASDAGEADLKLPGTPLWRRAEPGEDASLAQAIVDDLSAWVIQCAAS